MVHHVVERAAPSLSGAPVVRGFEGRKVKLNQSSRAGGEAEEKTREDTRGCRSGTHCEVVV